jgi:hypothetical protein
MSEPFSTRSLPSFPISGDGRKVSRRQQLAPNLLQKPAMLPHEQRQRVQNAVPRMARAASRQPCARAKYSQVDHAVSPAVAAGPLVDAIRRVIDS